MSYAPRLGENPPTTPRSSYSWQSSRYTPLPIHVPNLFLEYAAQSPLNNDIYTDNQSYPDPNRSFLPDIGNSRGTSNSKSPVPHQGRRPYNQINHSVLDQSVIRDLSETKAPHIRSRSQHIAVERPLARKYVADESFTNSRKSSSTRISLPNLLLGDHPTNDDSRNYQQGQSFSRDRGYNTHTPPRDMRSLSNNRPMPPGSKAPGDHFGKLIADINPIDNSDKKVYGKYLLDQVE